VTSGSKRPKKPTKTFLEEAYSEPNHYSSFMQSISDNVDADVSQLNLSTGRAKQFSKDSIELEGGSKRGAKKKDEEKDDKEAKLTAQMVKDTFH
jgi:hypothetical protein